MPIHPLKGLALKVVGSRREQLSRRLMIIAEVADGEHIELPVDWTDRGAPWPTPKLAGREVRLCARGLLALARGGRGPWPQSWPFVVVFVSVDRG